MGYPQQAYNRFYHDLVQMRADTSGIRRVVKRDLMERYERRHTSPHLTPTWGPTWREGTPDLPTGPTVILVPRSPSPFPATLGWAMCPFCLLVGYRDPPNLCMGPLL